jgi:hypothetical protein
MAEVLYFDFNEKFIWSLKNVNNPVWTSGNDITYNIGDYPTIDQNALSTFDYWTNLLEIYLID